MNGMRKLFCSLLVMVLAAFAMPSLAASPSKIFDIVVSPAALPSGTSTTVTVKVNNLTPNGNSNINAFIVSLPAGVSLGQVSLVGTLPSGTFTTCPASTPNGLVPPNSLCVVNISSIRPQAYYQFQLSVSIPASQVCAQSNWVGEAFTGNSLATGAQGQPFFDPNANSFFSPSVAYVGCDGFLACGDAFQKGAGPNAPGYVVGTRDPFNKDGTTGDAGCVAVLYNFTNPTNNNSDIARLYWTGQDSAVFSYTVNSQIVPINNGVPVSIARVAWFTDGLGNAILIPGQVCLTPNVPAPYGKLVLDSGSSITIDTTFGGSPPAGAATLPAPPFPIVIGTERIQVTTVSGSGASTVLSGLTRGAGGTTQVNHSPPAYVMSTPLPIQVGPYDAAQLAAGYAVGKQAQMCISDFEWESAGQDANGNQLVQYFWTVIDIGDGFSGP